MDMRFDGVNYFAADARLHYGSVSIKDGYIDRVDMADAAPHGGAKLLLPGCIDTHTHAMLQSEYFAEDEAASAAARRALAQSGTTAFLFATMAMDEASLALRCRAAARAVKQNRRARAAALAYILKGRSFPMKSAARIILSFCTCRTGRCCAALTTRRRAAYARYAWRRSLMGR